MQSKLRVHVATIDHHVERIVEPMIRLRADKAYLLAFDENDSASEFFKKTQSSLKKHHITIQVVYVDIWDLMACISTIRKIVQDERENQVFFNVSAGTKISAISFMLACMLWDCEPYYAKTEYDKMKFSKKAIPEKIKDVVAIPTYKMITPKTESLQLLKILRKNDGKIKKNILLKN